MLPSLAVVPDPGTTAEAAAHRTALADLAELLVTEFAGALTAPQVVQAVHEADRVVQRASRAAHRPMLLCETIARRLLHERGVHEMRRHVRASA
ncbi:hypothetical protein [Nocardioides marmotae]|uniref:Uncharacterized protein n=1 Tax=Nocardioides marmotae TaxID=2663857 RepID=A0A6I3J9R6_9ACTN|nr:hypothetical protein [Nocardioides marmotae]MCR6030754.1 hypothetical protein [Gordonia jinghuaiqii]MBC9733981.1 hypothetical protein [Nocardioides marmotae]MTB85084.1 hypothetical protein [Nocardioides marmotae]MTB94388.1 hypothetical protein [Nocardioides marmotae]QKE01586.1 hypothetical protein HPC71_11230 [Nocardioides marmotae]